MKALSDDLNLSTNTTSIEITALSAPVAPSGWAEANGLAALVSTNVTIPRVLAWARKILVKAKGVLSVTFLSREVFNGVHASVGCG
mgnify:CR=1 FL=1